MNEDKPVDQAAGSKLKNLIRLDLSGDVNKLFQRVNYKMLKELSSTNYVAFNCNKLLPSKGPLTINTYLYYA